VLKGLMSPFPYGLAGVIEAVLKPMGSHE